MIFITGTLGLGPEDGEARPGISRGSSTVPQDHRSERGEQAVEPS